MCEQQRSRVTSVRYMRQRNCFVRPESPRSGRSKAERSPFRARPNRPANCRTDKVLRESADLSAVALVNPRSRGYALRPVEGFGCERSDLSYRAAGPGQRDQDRRSADNGAQQDLLPGPRLQPRLAPHCCGGSTVPFQSAAVPERCRSRVLLNRAHSGTPSRKEHVRCPTPEPPEPNQRHCPTSVASV